jgi:AraC family transcriptional regulator
MLSTGVAEYAKIAHRVMLETAAYGSRMAQYLHLDQPPLYATLGSHRAQIAVTRLHAPNGFSEPTMPIPTEKAFSIHLHLRANHGGRLWLGGKLMPTVWRPMGGVAILDLETEPIAFFPNPIDVLQFYIPRRSLKEFAYENSMRMLETLRWPHCETDPALKHLGLTLLAAMEQPGQSSKLFFDYLGQAVLAHAAVSYGGSKSIATPRQGTLAPWQVRRATEFLRTHLDGDVSLASMAAECKLSVSHFARAFRETFGQPPHRWLIQRRIEAAKNLLLHTHLTLTEIAAECGFADQSAMNRPFTRTTGESPGAWRRRRKGHN